jgi:hypothetical protein
LSASCESAYSYGSRSPRPLVGAWVVSILSCWLVARPAICEADVVRAVKEYELKAAYLYNFTKFTSWPAMSFATESAPLVIGVLGNENFAKALSTVVKGQAVNGHAVEVRALMPSQALQGLHVLYVDVSVEGQLAMMGAALASPGMLTVGESEQFAAWGGAIRFVVDGDRLEFDINLPAAQRAGLGLSSQLLMLARSIRKSP